MSLTSLTSITSKKRVMTTIKCPKCRRETTFEMPRDAIDEDDEEYSLRPFTMEELNARIDQAERDIAEGRVYDFDEAMDELEKEFAEEDRKLELAEAL